MWFMCVRVSVRVCACVNSCVGVSVWVCVCVYVCMCGRMCVDAYVVRVCGSGGVGA